MSIIDTWSEQDMATQEVLAMMLVNKCRARAIGALIRHFDERPPTQDIDHPTIDQWNEEFHESTEDDPEWGRPRSTLTTARIWHDCAEYARQWCSTLTPLSIERMTMFMCTDGQERADEQIINAVKQITNNDIDDLRQLAKQMADRRKTRLAERQPLVIEQYRLFGDVGSADAFEQLSEDEHTRLCESILESLPRQQNRFIQRAFQGDELATTWLKAIKKLEEIL